MASDRLLGPNARVTSELRPSLIQRDDHFDIADSSYANVNVAANTSSSITTTTIRRSEENLVSTAGGYYLLIVIIMLRTLMIVINISHGDYSLYSFSSDIYLVVLLTFARSTRGPENCIDQGLSEIMWATTYGFQ